MDDLVPCQMRHVCPSLPWPSQMQRWHICIKAPGSPLVDEGGEELVHQDGPIVRVSYRLEIVPEDEALFLVLDLIGQCQVRIRGRLVQRKARRHVVVEWVDECALARAWQFMRAMAFRLWGVRRRDRPSFFARPRRNVLLRIARRTVVTSGVACFLRAR